MAPLNEFLINIFSAIKAVNPLQLLGGASKHDEVIALGFLVISVSLLLLLPAYCSFLRKEEKQIETMEEVKSAQFLLPDFKASRKEEKSNLFDSSSNISENTAEDNWTTTVENSHKITEVSVPEKKDSKLDKEWEKLFELLVPKKVQKSYDYQ